MFRNYPTIEFQNKIISDITVRASFSKKALESSAFTEYIIKDWISIDGLSHKLYGDSKYFWIILLANNIIDPVTEWLLSSEELDLLIKRKYKSPVDIHHYELNNIFYFPNSSVNIPYNAIPVTNEEYETDINEKKRKILVAIPNAVEIIENNLLKVLSRNAK